MRTSWKQEKRDPIPATPERSQQRQWMGLIRPNEYRWQGQHAPAQCSQQLCRVWSLLADGQERATYETLAQSGLPPSDSEARLWPQCEMISSQGLGLAARPGQQSALVGAQAQPEWK